MRSEQFIEIRQFIDDMPFRAPVKPRTAVDIYFLIRQPLDPTGETKRAVDTRQGT